MPYDTELSPEEEAKFAAQFPDPQSTRDYDMRGAFKAGIGAAGNGHYPDTYKKPNHITFSDQSIYHGKDGNFGGKWEKLEGGKWAFTPGPTNIKNYSMEQLADYFRRFEPDSELRAPSMESAVTQAVTPAAP